MKKIIIASLLASLIVISLVGCGNSGAKSTNTKETTKQEQTQSAKKWQPKELAELNTAYRDKSDKNPDGSFAIINVSGIEKKDDSINVKCFAPSYTLLKYSLDKFMAIQVLDENGKNLNVKNIAINTADNENGEIDVTGDFSTAKYIQITPYKTSNDNFITFEIK